MPTSRRTTVLMRWFDPAAWLELAQEHAVQISAVVPSMLQLLVAQPLEDYDLSALCQLACGAAPLPADLADELALRLPGVEIREGYGLTETSALVSSNPPGRVRAGSVGPPVEGTEVAIVDEHDRESPGGRGRRDLLPLGDGHARILARPGAHGRGDARRLAPHRRHGPPRRGRLPLRRRPQEGPDHPRGLQRLPARRRGGAARAPGRSRPRASSAGRTRPGARRSSRSSRCGPATTRRQGSWRPSARSGSAATSTHAKCTCSPRSRTRRSGRSTAKPLRALLAAEGGAP